MFFLFCSRINRGVMVVLYSTLRDVGEVDCMEEMGESATSWYANDKIRPKADRDMHCMRT